MGRVVPILFVPTCSSYFIICGESVGALLFISVASILLIPSCWGIYYLNCLLLLLFPYLAQFLPPTLVNYSFAPWKC